MADKQTENHSRESEERERSPRCLVDPFYVRLVYYTAAIIKYCHILTEKRK